MRAAILVTICLVCLVGCSGSSEAPQAAGPSTARESSARPGGAGHSPVRFKTYSCVDHDGIGTEAFRLLVPTDWRVEAGVTWQASPSMPAILTYRLSDPRTLRSVEQLPIGGYVWMEDAMFQSYFPVGSLYQGSVSMPPAGAVAYIRQTVLPQSRGGVQGMRVISSEEDPQTAQEFARQYARMVPASESRITADAGSVTVEYVERGREIHEEFHALLVYVQTPVTGMNGSVMTTVWGPETVHALKTEKGLMPQSAGLFQTILKSYRLNPTWFGRLQKLIDYMVANQLQSIQSVGQLSASISRNNDEISDMIASSYNQRQEMYDRVFDSYSRSVRGVDEYTDGSGTAVELPSGYSAAWTNGLGEYIVSDQAGFNPNVGSTVDWKPMNRKN